MAAVTHFRQLVVWQKSHQLALKVYKLTQDFPAHERFGLAKQMRRAAVSIPANIAEGFGRRGKKDKANFYTISAASLNELEYYFILCQDLDYYRCPPEIVSLCREVSKMLSAMIQKTLESRPTS